MTVGCSLEDIKKMTDACNGMVELTWNLDRMSKCFFISVPRTWLMAQLRACRTSSGVMDSGCRASCTHILGQVHDSCRALLVCVNPQVAKGTIGKANPRQEHCRERGMRYVLFS